MTTGAELAEQGAPADRGDVIEYPSGHSEGWQPHVLNAPKIHQQSLKYSPAKS